MRHLTTFVDLTIQSSERRFRRSRVRSCPFNSRNKIQNALFRRQLEDEEYIYDGLARSKFVFRERNAIDTFESELGLYFRSLLLLRSGLWKGIPKNHRDDLTSKDRAALYNSNKENQSIEYSINIFNKYLIYNTQIILYRRHPLRKRLILISDPTLQPSFLSITKLSKPIFILLIMT